MKIVAVQLALCGLMMTVCWHAEVLATQSAPNVVFILADDLGYGDVGFHGSTVIRTPTLDRLAQNGVRLNNYYVQPICTPTRSQLLSGRYQIHTGLQHRSIYPCQPNGLPEDMPTLANMMRDAGYATHMVGKWHIGFYKEQLLPTRRGFDSFFGLLNGRGDYYTHSLCTDVGRSLGMWELNEYLLSNPDKRRMKHGICGFDLRSNETAVRYSGQYSTHLFTQKAIDVIKSHSRKQDTKPLFLYLAYQTVHSPLQIPESYTKPYASVEDENRRMYAGMTACMDEGVLNVTSALEKYGLWNNTILIFSTDNGGEVAFGGNNWPLRGWKRSLWEGGMRGIGFVHSPLIRRRGTINNGLMDVSDWFPTILGLAGRDTAGLDVDGFDVWTSISDGEPSPRRELLHNIDPLVPRRGSRLNVSSFDNRVRAAIRVGNWKLITGNPLQGSWIAPPEDTGCHSVPDPDPKSKNIWLFDISNDPNEKTDLFDSHRDIAVEMLNRLAEYQTTAVPARYPPNDLRCDPKHHNGFWGPWVHTENLPLANEASLPYTISVRRLIAAVVFTFFCILPCIM